MKPNFALSLSFEGIRLFHRADGGWRIVGTVDVASSELTNDLAELRDKALEIDPNGMCTKLIIPDDQIKYLTLDTGQRDMMYRSRVAKEALEGTTPYPIDELSFALSANGPLTHIAAVARETLREAESFAKEHNFAPVSWVAIPSSRDFVGEPFFGQTPSAAEVIGQAAFVEADFEKVTILKGMATRPPSQPNSTEVSPPTPPVSNKNPSPVIAPSDKIEALSNRQVVQNTPAPSRYIKPEANPSPLSTSAPQKDTPASPKVLPTPVITKPEIESERLTVFGAREANGLAPEKKKGLFSIKKLAALLLLSGGGVAVAAMVFMGNQPPQTVVSSQPSTITTSPNNALPAPSETSETALSPEDAVISDAPRQPAPPKPPVPLPRLTMEELIENYPTSGIWPQAPQAPQVASRIAIEDLYIINTDPVSTKKNVVALPDSRSFDTDQNFQIKAAAAQSAFALNEAGLVKASPTGTLTPEGVMVYLARPFTVPPPRPAYKEPVPEVDPVIEALSKIRPRTRPANLIEESERLINGGLSNSELAEVRPKRRPASITARATATEEEEKADAQKAEAAAAAKQEAEAAAAAQKAAEAAAAAAAIADAQKSVEAIKEPENPQAVRKSVRPDSRPRNFARTVKRALDKQSKESNTSAKESNTRVASVAPATVKPRIPSSTSVAKNATLKNAIKLGRTNLIGVTGKPSSRRALVRLSNGRIKKVKVGDRIDGGRVTAIGESQVRYKKGGRNLTLNMPK